MENFYLSLETAKQLKEWGCKLESDRKYIERWNGAEEEISNYHILEDVCCKHSIKFFCELRSCVHASEILKMLRMEYKEEAEKYLLDNCIFNPKNR